MIFFCWLVGWFGVLRAALCEQSEGEVSDAFYADVNYRRLSWFTPLTLTLTILLRSKCKRDFDAVISVVEFCGKILFAK